MFLVVTIFLIAGTFGQTVTIVSNPAGTPVSGLTNTFDYPILSRVTLTCMVEPSSNDATYLWNTTGCYTNGHRTSSNCFPGVDKNEQTITDDNLLAEDAGTINCTVTIGGVTHSGSITLRISGIDILWMNAQAIYLNV